MDTAALCLSETSVQENRAKRRTAVPMKMHFGKDAPHGQADA
jgi:hypothetical protein